jgi:hypothetical protein
MDYVLLRASPDGADPPAVQDLLDATERARTLAREAIAKMNSRMAEHVNAHRRDVKFQIGDLNQNLRFPVGATRDKKFASRWIGPFSVVDRIADGRAYRIDLPSHMHLHPTFHVSSIKLMSTTLSHLVFVQLQCGTYSRMGMRSGRLVLLCRTDGGLQTYNI